MPTFKIIAKSAAETVVNQTKEIPNTIKIYVINYYFCT